MRTRLRSKISLLFVAFAALLAVPAVVLAAELATSAEVVGSTNVNQVVVEQGKSANFNIKLSAAGSIRCSTLETTPAWAKVKTSYSLDSSGALTASDDPNDLSGQQNFWAEDAAAGSSGNCKVTWDVAPTSYSVPATVSADANTPAGTYTDKIVLSEAAGTVKISNPNSTGAKLNDADATKITVEVVEPAPPADTTPPTITINKPEEGKSYTLGQTVLADYSCADEEGGSGLKSCVGDVNDGAAIDTSSIGPKTFTVNAEDNAGNKSSSTKDYNVIYDFKGFFPPVDNMPEINKAKAGSAIPVKFSLTGNQGLGIFADTYPRSGVITCGTDPDLDAIEQTVTAGSSSLSYDASTDTYNYVWKTEKSWGSPSTCRQLVLKLDDDTFHRANFKFVK